MTDRHLESFLLGECEESVAVEIEDRLFAEKDDVFLHRLQNVKLSLLQWEVAGRLTAMQSKALAEQCQRSPKLAAELAEIRARGLRTPPGRIALVPAAQPSSRPAAPQTSAFSWRAGLGFAAAAVLAIVAGGLVRRHQAARPSSLVATSAADPSPEIPGQARPAPNAVATVLFLPAGVLRTADAPKPLPLPDPTRPVDLQIEIRGTAAQQRIWSATLLRGSQPILPAQPVSLKSEGAIHFATLQAPSGVLTSGDYHLTLTPESPSVAPIDRTFRISEK